ncbi:MAG TPA: hypothetical protein VM425_03910 [Myxococcota bacterium]|nr:hypothetical protein [Myxococcota bacterium]
MGQATSTVKSCTQIFALFCLAIACGCGDKTEAHLEHFLDPAAAGNASPPESLDPFAITNDGKAADRINTMDFDDVARRLGPHRTTARTRFAFAGPKVHASLREEDMIVLARNGDFRVKVENESGQGYEVVYSAKHLYMRNRYGTFHERETLAGDHLKWRAAAYGGWAAVYRLYRGSLGFTKLGMVRHNGRDAVRFSIGMSDAKPRPVAGAPASASAPVPAGVTKYVLPIEPTPSERDRWRDKVKPLSASGTILVDADCGAVLGVDFSGELGLPSPGDGGEIALTVKTVLLTDGFGNPPSIAAPDEKEIRPVPERIKVDTHPIDFYFGKGFTSSLGAAAGVARDAEKRTQKTKSTGGSTSRH